MIKISSFEKLEEKFNNNPVPKDLSFMDAKRFLEHYGCTFTNHSGGSHYAVKHPGVQDTIILPRHEALKRYNIRQARDFVDKIKAQEEDK